MIQEAKLGKVLSGLTGEFQTLAGDPEVFLSRVADLAPELDKERFILRFFLVFGGFEKLTNKAKNEKDYQKNISQICNEINYQFGIDKQDIAGVCIAFAMALGVNLNAKEIYEAVSPRPVIQKGTAPAPAPAPAPAAVQAPASSLQPVAAVPVSYEAEQQYHQGGTGVKCSKGLGAGSFRKAAEDGHIDAAFAYAECCRAGYGVKKDLDEAKKWYTDAAKKGHPGAQLALADLYEDPVRAEPERRVVYAAEKVNLDNPRLADILPTYNHMTYDARAAKHAFVYLLLALHAFLSIFVSSLVYSTPRYDLFPLHEEFRALLTVAAPGKELLTAFWTYVILTCLISFGIVMCCRLEERRARIFRADNTDKAWKLRKFLMILTIVLLFVFSVANPTVINAWRMYGPQFALPVISFFRNLWYNLGMVDGTGSVRNIVPAIAYIPVLLLTCTIIIAMQATTFRRFNQVLHRYWILPVLKKKHRLVRVPVLLALVIFILLGRWIGLEVMLPLCVLLLVIPRKFYF